LASTGDEPSVPTGVPGKELGRQSNGFEEAWEDFEAAQRRFIATIDFAGTTSYTEWYPRLISIFSLMINVAFVLLAAYDIGADTVAGSALELQNGFLYGLPAMAMGAVIEAIRVQRNEALTAAAFSQVVEAAVGGANQAEAVANAEKSLLFKKMGLVGSWDSEGGSAALARLALLASAPLALFAEAVLGDIGFGEKLEADLCSGSGPTLEEGGGGKAAAAAEASNRASRAAGQLALLMVGTLASSAWLHDVAQFSAQSALNRLGNGAAVALMPSDLTFAEGADALGAPGAWESATNPFVASVWPVVAALPAAAPWCAALFATVLGACLDTIVDEERRPALRLTRNAQAGALEVASGRGAAYFALSGGGCSAERAERRGKALALLVEARAKLLDDTRDSARAAAVARAALGSLAYLASGGAPLAPVMAYLGAELAPRNKKLPNRAGKLP